MSHGSRCPYRDFPRGTPVNEQSGLPTDHFLQPLSGSCRLSLKLSELALSSAPISDRYDRKVGARLTYKGGCSMSVAQYQCLSSATITPADLIVVGHVERA